MSVVAQEVIGLCAKDLIWCSETKYHASFYKASLRIQYTTGNTREGESSNDYDMTCNLRMIRTVYRFDCKSTVIEFKQIRKLFSDVADKLGIGVPDSHSKNLMQKMSK